LFDLIRGGEITMQFSAFQRKRMMTLASGFVLLLVSGTAQAEWVAAVYGGLSDSRDSDVELSQPGGSNLTFADVSWDNKSFDNPLYYGLRVTYWPDSAARWGVSVDFTHDKIYADRNKTVHVSGTRGGSPVDTQEPLSNTFDVLAMSHGLNLLTVNGVYRWLPDSDAVTFWSRLTPYVGFGGGLAYPHVEVTTGGSVTDEYQLAGWVLNGLAGLNYSFGPRWSIFAEYKISYADIRGDLNGGGTLDTAVWTNHYNFGVSYRFGQK
jgi:hypothetical protein